MFGLVGGVLVTLLKLVEYKYLVVERSVEIYGALIAALFAVLGIWLGIRLTGKRETAVVKEVQVIQLRDTRAAVTGPGSVVLIQRKREELGITPRELEILGLVAEGLSNREIAGKLFVSENTVKTHCSRAFDKLGAKRRTQAVQLGRELG